MSTKKTASPKAKSPKPKASLEELLKDAGFSKVRKINERVIHASGTDDFSKAHAAFLQAAGKHPALIGCSEFPSVGNRLLIVHRRPVAAEVGGQTAEGSGSANAGQRSDNSEVSEAGEPKTQSQRTKA